MKFTSIRNFKIWLFKRLPDPASKKVKDNRLQLAAAIDTDMNKFYNLPYVTTMLEYHKQLYELLQLHQLVHYKATTVYDMLKNTLETSPLGQRRL